MMDEDKIKKIFAKNLIYYLDKRDKNQTELAKYMNVSGTTITNWTKAYKMPRMNKIDRICQFLSITINDLLNDYSQNPIHENTNTYISNFTISPEEIDMIKKYRCLPPEGKATVDAVINVQYEAVKPKVKDEPAV